LIVFFFCAWALMVPISRRHTISSLLVWRIGSFVLL
jgi:hypothetical protein